MLHTNIYASTSLVSYRSFFQIILIASLCKMDCNLDYLERGIHEDATLQISNLDLLWFLTRNIFKLGCHGHHKSEWNSLIGFQTMNIPANCPQHLPLCFKSCLVTEEIVDKGLCCAQVSWKCIGKNICFCTNSSVAYRATV